MSEKILEAKSSQQFKDDYIRYGIYILYRRVLSDYRDGLKPVQRRILWAMYKNTKAISTFVKSAAVVGDTMKLYHPHSNCKHGSTMLYTLANEYVTIEDMYKSGVERVDIMAVDPVTGSVIPAVASNFRIGVVANKECRIHLSNGYVDVSTLEHPYLTEDMRWVLAKDLTPNTRLYERTMRFDTNNRPTINREPLHCIVHDYYFGAPPKGYERHHKDWNYMNNTPSNIVALTKMDHVNEHKYSQSSIDALEAGRAVMFTEGTNVRDKIRAKNSILASEFNKDQGIRRFKYVINMMRENGMEITEENYESFRGSIYNLPIISRLIERHSYGSTFEELVNYEPVSIGELFDARKAELESFEEEKVTLIKPIKFFYEGRSMIYDTFNRMLLQNIPLTVENYFAYTSRAYNKSSVDPNRIAYLINLYRIECPYVDYVEIVDVADTPYYDFTVEGVENMLIPVSTNANNEASRDIGINIPFICIHNSALYGTMKPMANWFETNMPLIEASGNFGTFQGDPAAAERYTECRLSKFAIENVLADVIDSEKSVDWSPTYSGTSVEPDYLPVKVPLLLINGSFGIGLGMRADIPTHNLNEVIDATLMLMDNPDAEVVLVPDHCMRCEIFETDFAKICKAGFGHYRIRGVIDIEDYKGRKALVIKSVPNLTYLDSVTNKIEDLIKAKKIIQIDNCFDESTINEMRYVIVLKPGADPNYVKEVIYKNTTLEQTLRINFETLNGLNPLRMSYKAYLTSFIDFRKLTKFRVYQNRLQAVQTKLHERDAYIKVLESGEVDNIIAMIKKQRTVDDGYLIEYLVKKLKITDLQARYIIDANLKKLSYGYLEKYKREATELNIQRAELIRHIMDDKVIEDDIRQELLEVKRKYGRPRNCRIISNAEVNDIPQGAMTIAITEKNFVRKVPAGVNIGNFKNDAIRTCINIDNTDSVVIFDEMGKVFKLPVHKIPFTDKNTNGTDIRFLVKSLTANINTIIPESVMKNLASVGCHNDKHYLVTLTRNGLIKRMDLDDFITVPPSGILYAKIDAGDCVKDIVIAHSALSLIVYANRKAVIIPVNDVPYLKRNTKGSKSMSNVDYVDGLCVISSDCTDICVITESGKINRINIIHSMPNSTKGKSGSNLIKLSPKDKIVAVVSGNERDIIHIKCVSTEYTFRIGNLEIGSSISAGFKALTTRNDKIIHCWVQKQ